MTERVGLLATLDRLFAGPRRETLTVHAFLDGLGDRSYAFIIAALDLPNCVPTGLPLLSTVTGVPMLLLAIQYFLRQPSPWLPDIFGKRALERGRLQDSLDHIRPYIARLENAVHPRHDWWVSGTPRWLMQFVWALLILLLALPVPFDNMLPAWAILFFCLALIERDGVMAIFGWVFTLLTTAWTIFLAIVGPLVVLHVVKSVLSL
ncbi:MAG TPA: exopolysaccharide biosynthesis protein [Reyranella sp.]|nr:exopolysaccharide biosynthesis protein [Reyranella sp.]